jgi:hypothetical protein
MDALILFLQVASLLALLVVGWLVKSYIPSYFSEKGKNLATKEDIEEITRKIEQVKASLGSRLHIHQTRYDHEFKLLLELSEKLVTAREAATGLRPEAAYDDIKEAQVREKRYNRYIDAAKDLYLFTETRQPFFPEAIYNGLKRFDQVTWKEAVQLKHWEPNKPDYWDDALKAGEEIETIASALLILIRNRIQRWETFDPGP